MEVLWRATGISVFQWGARIGFLALCCLGLPVMTVREYALLVMALVLAGVSFTTIGLDALWDAVSLGAFFGAFIAALTAMRDIAARSRSVLELGQYLVRQPPGRRFVATALGGHFMGVFLNFGAVSLMSPLVQQSAVTADGKKNLALEQRQLSALIRGFAWVLLWAPTTLSQAVLLTLFTDVTWSDIGPLGLATGALFIVIGRLLDRYEWRRASETGPVPPFPKGAFAKLSGLCSGLIGATVVGSFVTGATVAVTLLWVAPVTTVLWYVFQPRAKGGLASILSQSAPSLTRSAIALGLSGFIGRLAGQSIGHMTDLSWLAPVGSMPAWLLLAALPILITLGGQVALSPILLVVLLGELLSAVPVLPTDQWQIVFALSVGWALSMTASPNATATLLISATSGIAPTILTWRWNLKYGFLCYFVAVGIFAIIA